MPQSIVDEFPRFDAPPEGGVTAWFTMQITQIANGATPLQAADIHQAIKDYEDRDERRRTSWNGHFHPSKDA